MSENSKAQLEANYKNLERVIGFVSIADNKAKFILSIELVILGFLMTQAKVVFRIIALLGKSGGCLKICGSMGFLAVFALYIIFAIIITRKEKTAGIRESKYVESTFY